MQRTNLSSLNLQDTSSLEEKNTILMPLLVDTSLIWITDVEITEDEKQALNFQPLIRSEILKY